MYHLIVDVLMVARFSVFRFSFFVFRALAHCSIYAAVAAGVTSSLLAYAYSGLQFLWRTATNDTCPLKKPHRLLRTSLDKLALHF